MSLLNQTYAQLSPTPVGDGHLTHSYVPNKEWEKDLNSKFPTVMQEMDLQNWFCRLRNGSYLSFGFATDFSRRTTHAMLAQGDIFF